MQWGWLLLLLTHTHARPRTVLVPQEIRDETLPVVYEYTALCLKYIKHPILSQIIPLFPTFPQTASSPQSTHLVHHYPLFRSIP